MSRKGPRVVFIEGLPGSGKSTLAEALASAYRAAGAACEVSLELDEEWLLIDRLTRASAAQPGFLERCLAQVARFGDGMRRRPPDLR